MSDIRAKDEALLEQALEAIHRETEELDPKREQEALDRVERSLRELANQPSRVFDCASLRELLPAYRAGELSPERALLVEDHARVCIPCRRAMRGPSRVEPPAPARSAGASRGRWAWAAALLLGLGLVSVLYIGAGIGGDSESFELVSGSLMLPGDESVAALPIGSEVSYGREVVTPRGDRAVVELADGSRVELRERSRLQVASRRGGTTIELAAGNIVVEAADQSGGRLYVATDDCLVAVKGTVFSVNHGTRGSRVAVFEGEVEVNEGGRDHVLNPGDQVSTRPGMGSVSLADEIAWSAHAEQHLALLRELSDLNLELRARPHADLRYESALLDLLPESTVAYLALPNFSESIRETLILFEARMQTSSVLNDWAVSSEELDHLREAIDRVAPLGEKLGEELVIAGWWRGDEMVGPALLAESTQSASLRADLAAELDRVGDHDLVLVVDPYGADLPEDGLLIWVSERGVIAAPGATALREIADAVRSETTRFAGTEFHERLQSRYDQGVSSILAVDLRPWVEQSGSTDPGLARLGFDGAQDLIVEQRTVGERVERQANLSFDGSREGVAAWLSPPAPMMSLSFFSPDTTTVAAALVEDPSRLFSEMLATMTVEEAAAVEDDLDTFAAEHGWDPREDFLAALGGEVAVALDGPLVPVPSWKVVLEVYDPARLQHGIEQFLADANDELVTEGKTPFSLEPGAQGSWVISRSADATEIPLAVHYAYIDGYLVATPSAALLDRARRFHDTAFNLATSDRISGLLPADGQMNYSALWYQDFSGLLEPLGGILSGSGLAGELPPEIREELASIGEDIGPTLVYATGADDEITLASTSNRNPLGLLQLLAVRDLMDGL